MSNISNRHTVTKFVAGESKPLSGQRLARVGYKTTHKTPAKYPSICASVPQINPEHILGNVTKLLPYICTMLEETQDKILRSLYESSDGTLQAVTDDDISVEQCVAYLAAEAAGTRLTTELVEAWFDAQVSDNLVVVVATKLGYSDLTPENLPTVQKHVKVYRALLSSLAGGKTVLTPTQIQGCKRALEVSSVDDETSRKLNARLTALEAKPKMEELLEL